jgi:endonuclease III
MRAQAATPARPTLAGIARRLERHYGPPEPPVSRDPLELIIWENVAYLANDQRRARAFAELKERVGTDPEDILKADRKTLAGIAQAGIVPDISAEKLIEVAKIAYEEFGSNLRPVLRLPLAKAKKALRRFPGIGEPGAEKILLFCGAYPMLALESNGLRVLRRLGYGKDDKNYALSYRSVQMALSDQAPADCEWLTLVHQLLRQHGKELCKVSKPRCEACPLRTSCQYGAALASA